MANWDASFEASPAGAETPSQGDNKIRELKEAIRERLEREHIQVLANPAATQQGEHKNGSAKVYFGAVEPTLQPDAVTALSASDNGRLWIRSSDYSVWVYNHSEAVGERWVRLTSLVGGDNDWTGENTFSGDVIANADADFSASTALVLNTRDSDPTTPIVGQVWIRTDV